jgi:hypothetical protein
MTIKKSEMSLLPKRIKLVHLADIIINQMSIRRNDVVMVYTSLHDLKHFDFQPGDFIYLLKMIIGTEGILLMPVPGKSNLTQINTHSQPERLDSLQGNDLISAAFLKMPDTISLNYPAYTLAAWGKHASSIIDNNSITDPNPDYISLRYKLNQLKTKFIGLEVPVKKNSFFNGSTPEQGKNMLPEDTDRFNNGSLEIILELFEKKEFKLFTEQGISYKWLDRSK